MKLKHPGLTSCGLGLLALLLAMSVPTGVATAAIEVALHTASLTVAPGSDFEVDIEVTQAGTSFNAYGVCIGWTPSAVTLAPTAPTSLQEGAYMTSPCGNTFMDFHAFADSATLAHSLLCGQVGLPGPGQVYRLHFHASSTPQVTVIRFTRPSKFYMAGVRVGPVTSSDLSITIGSAAGVEAGASALPLAIRAETNPSHGRTWLRVEAPAGTPTALVVRDAAGRLVRQLDDGDARPGNRSVFWDGQDRRGGNAPSGAYWLVLRAGGRQAVSRLTLVR